MGLSSWWLEIAACWRYMMRWAVQALWRRLSKTPSIQCSTRISQTATLGSTLVFQLRCQRRAKIRSNSTINGSNYFKKVVTNTWIMRMMDLSSLKTVINRKRKTKIMKVTPMTNNMTTNNSNTNWRSTEIASSIRTAPLEATLSWTRQCRRWVELSAWVTLSVAASKQWTSRIILRTTYRR